MLDSAGVVVSAFFEVLNFEVVLFVLAAMFDVVYWCFAYNVVVNN